MNTSVKEKQLSLKTPSIKIDDKGFMALSKRELSSLKKRISSLLEELPGDTLIISKSNGCTQYYRYSKAHRSRKIFIPGDSIEYAKQLATREYLEMLSAEIDRQLEADFVLSVHDTRRLHDIYGNMRIEKRRLIKPIFVPDSEFVDKWYDAHPGSANGYEITNRYDTERGEAVRSKSEKIIADKLYAMNVPYTYESRLDFDDGRYCYPDFTILNVATRRTWYWEHFGLTDDEEYRNNMSHKLNMYESNGFFSGEGLITTVEGEHTGLDTKLMVAKIKKYLLE